MTNSQQPSQPQTVNQTAQTIGEVIAGVDSAIVEVAEDLAIAQYPWLGYPILKQIWQALFGYFSGLFTLAAQTGATFAVIDYQIGDEEDEISKELAAIAAAEKAQDPVALKAAIKAYADANSALLHSDGSYRPIS
jgi:hypothetical protein